MSYPSFLLINTVLILTLFNTLQAQTDSADYAINDSLIGTSDLFAVDEPAEITLKFNFREYFRSKRSDIYHEAELIYHLGDTLEDIHRIVRIKARGNSRREICNFPPIKLNISKADIKKEALREVKSIKLVTHCSNSQSNTNYLLKEFLVYKMYNIVSPYSFHVRLVKIRYVDTGKKGRVNETWAFLIEPETLMAKRLDMISIKQDQLGMAHMDSAQMRTLAVFQYLIGNADYSITGRHNIKLLKSKEINAIYPIPVPYDFDYSGIVDASYAVPGENLGIQSVQERYFLGPCADVSDYLKTMDYFLSLKNEVYSLINDFEFLGKKEKVAMIRYLDEFYYQPANDRYISNNILTTCR